MFLVLAKLGDYCVWMLTNPINSKQVVELASEQTLGVSSPLT